MGRISFMWRSRWSFMSAKASLSSTRAATKDRTVASLLRFKALYLAILLGGLWFWNGFDKDNFNDVDARWPREGGPIFASHFGTWDAAHYLYLSEVGYGKNMPSCAFYPLWPVLVRCFSVVTGGSHLVAGMVLANVFSLIAFGLFLQMVNDRFDRSSAMLSLVFLLAFPGSLFFQFIYSEGLFFLLLMVLWWNLERRRYAIAWGAAFLLPISRAVGLFCLFPIAWHLVTKEPPAWILGGAGRFRRLRRIGGMSQLAEREELPELLMTTTPGRQREEARSEIRGKSNLVPSAATGWAWWLLLAPFLGWTCYLALMWHWAGNPLEGFEAQKHWRVHSIVTVRRGRLTVGADGVAGWRGETTIIDNPHGPATSY